MLVDCCVFLSVARCLLFVVRSLVPAVVWSLGVCCELFVVCCMMFVACRCLLCGVVCCVWFVAVGWLLFADCVDGCLLLFVVCWLLRLCCRC